MAQNYGYSQQQQYGSHRKIRGATAHIVRYTQEALKNDGRGWHLMYPPAFCDGTHLLPSGLDYVCSEYFHHHYELVASEELVHATSYQKHNKSQQSYTPQPPQPTYVPVATQPTYTAQPVQQQQQSNYSNYNQTQANAAYAAYNAQSARPAVVTVAVTPQYQAVVAKPSSYNTSYNTSQHTGSLNKPQMSQGNYGFVSGSSMSQNNRQTQSTYQSGHKQPQRQQQQQSDAAGNANSGYDTALYNAASSFYNQQQSHVNKVARNIQSDNAGWHAKKDSSAAYQTGTQRGGYRGQKPWQKYNNNVTSTPPTPSHYCEVCKISCMGPQTYKEHLEGQKHKKKAAQQDSGLPSQSIKTGQSQLKCDLCDITCTGTDAYSAHIRGSKHQKTLKLHQRMGKTIPSSDPTILTAKADKTIEETKAPAGTINKVVNTINFVGGSTLKSTGVKTEEVKATTAASGTPKVNTEEELLLPGEKSILPVGHEYIEETVNAAGKLLNYTCKLCDCEFTDPSAKNMHLKGRRHRTNYKKKVDPTLQVDMKSAGRGAFIKDREHEQRVRKNQVMQKQEKLNATKDIRALEADRFIPAPTALHKNNDRFYTDRIESFTDRHIVAKHANIYPTEGELMAVQACVTACERALKIVSDTLHKEKVADGETVEGQEVRIVKGVMRVGDLAKGLLLTGNLDIDLVVLCARKPTENLLKRVTEILPGAFTEIEETAYIAEVKTSEAAVLVSKKGEPKVTCHLYLASPLVRDDKAPVVIGEEKPSETAYDSSTLLDKQLCLNALASLRHAKWFQARASIIPSCVLLLRVLKDMRIREERFTPISQWCMELLLERCMNTAVSPMGAGDAMRRFFECLASGIALPFGAGLSDPCEREAKNVFDNLTVQQREDLTQFAQDCVRQIAFNRVSQILDIELQAPTPLPVEAKKRKLSKEAEESANGQAAKKEKSDDTIPKKL